MLAPFGAVAPGKASEDLSFSAACLRGAEPLAGRASCKPGDATWGIPERLQCPPPARGHAITAPDLQRARCVDHAEVVVEVQRAPPGRMDPAVSYARDPLPDLGDRSARI